MTHDLSARGIEGWLLFELGARLGIDSRSVDPRERFSRYGLTSLLATGLIAELSALVGRKLPATLVWDHPTIERLARHLGGEESGASGTRIRRLPDGEPIAIVGMACRFPLADGLEAFWRLLSEGVDAIREVPPDRWNADALFDPDPARPGKMSTRWGGFLDGIDRFDAAFFGISPREAVQMDPQQRLFLEVAWAALEDAAIAPTSLRGTRSGVFAGAMWSEYGRGSRSLEAISQHTATGRDTGVIANRVSYELGLEGPSLTVNTACSSSLVALHLACESLRAGESTLALAGGVNLIVSPASTVAMTKFGAMSPDGRSKAFDASANGYVRGEGCGVVALRPLSLALAAGDRIYCVVRGSAVNNDGLSNGLTAPSPEAQEKVLRDACARAGIEGREVQYVEAHGTGTALGDPIEAGALGAVLGKGRAPDAPLLVGSVKTNIGHLEAAAGIAGLIKVALGIQRRTIPPSLHFHRPSPHIPFEALGLKVQAELSPWPAGRATAGVSSFGFGGTNAHAILQELEVDDGGSGRGEPLLAQEPVAGPKDAAPSEAARVVFVFSGNGSQWRGMGRDLLQSEPVFRQALEACDRSFRLVTDDLRILEEISSGERRSGLPEVCVGQCLLFAVQVALASFWRALGVGPSAVVGHSLGEVAAAHVAGALGLDDAARIVFHRSLLQSEVAGQGAMALVELPADEVAPWLAGREGMAVAGVNDPRSTVVSGPVAEVERLAGELSAKGVRCHRIAVDVAYHGPQMEPLKERLVAVLEGLAPRPARIPIVSTVTGERIGGEELDPSYWGRNLREPVLFARAIDRLAGEGHGLFLELSGHPIVERSIQVTLGEPGRNVLVAGSLRRGEGGGASLLRTRSALGERGVPVRSRPTFSDRPLHLLPLSAASPEALRELAARYRAEPGGQLADLCHTAAAGRAHLAHRLAVVAGDDDSLREALGAFAERKSAPRLIARSPESSRAPRIGFLFTGQGSQYTGMGRELWETQPTFREAIERCGALLAREIERPLVEILFDPAARIDDTANAQPALFALEWALAELWRSWGVLPDVVLGHSVGEIVAACVAGAISLPDALRLVAARGRLMQALPPGGLMAAVSADPESVRDAITHVGQVAAVAVAAVNGPRSCVLSGEAEAVRATLARLGARGARWAELAVSHAFHSPAMEPMTGPFGEVVREMSFPAPRLPIVSCLPGGGPLDARHWVRHVREPVLFADAVTAARDGGCELFVEIGPSPVLTGMAAAFLKGPVWLPSLRRGRGEWEEILGTLSELTTRGVPVDWRGFDRDYPRRRVAAPTYPFQRERHWLEEEAAGVAPEEGSPVYELRWEEAPRPPAGDGGRSPLPAGALGERLGRLGLQPPADGSDRRVGEAADRLASCYAARALVGLGWDGDAASLDRLDVAPRHRRLARRLAAMATDGVEVGTPSFEATPELTLVRRCGESLGEILGGRVDGLSVVFPGGSLDEAFALYADSSFSRRANRLVREAVEAVVDLLPPSGRLRVLELGAGTGGTTKHLLPLLPPDRTEYLFTDLSPRFLAEAGRRFAGFPFLETAVLDVEAGVEGTPLEGRRFDVVVAVNVLHATADLGRTLDTVRSLLAEGGLLVLGEVTGRPGWLDLVFGLLDGWWRFADHDLRPDHPLLDADGWRRLLAERRFSDVFVVPATDRQSLILARPKAARWLVLGGARGGGERIVRGLGERGAEGLLVRRGEPTPPEEFAGMVHLRALDGAGPADAALLCREVQSLVAPDGPGRRPDLWIVTRGVQPLGTPVPAAAIGGSTLWGLGRVLALGDPGRRVRLVDLGDAGDVESLVEELLAPTDEEQVALRGGKRAVARLVADRMAGPAAEIRGDRSYLVTGGLGALGIELARWLVARGARHVTLVGRRPPSAAAEAAIEAMRLRQPGTHVEAVQGDVARRDEMEPLLARIAASGAPLAGVFHVAGSRSADLDEALRGKVEGAWLLHELTRGLPLYLFVLFSSAAAVWGDRELSAYAAANHALGTLAHYRRGEGLAATCVDWGRFEVRGMVTPEVAEALDRIGLEPLAIDGAFDLLLRLAGSGIPQRVVARVDWERFLPVYEGRRRRPLLTRIRQAARGAVAVPLTALPAPGRRGGAGETRAPGVPARFDGEALFEVVRGEVASVLGAASPQVVEPRRGFFEMGLDSLMAVELRGRLERRLGRTIAAADLFSHPTVEALARFLGEGEPVSPTGDGAGRRRAAADEPIAVVGIGCRFPGGVRDPEGFGRLLFDGVDAVSVVPPTRWDADRWYDPDPDAAGKMSTRWGGFLDGVDLFDAELFGISPREAAEMDPQQRILLEEAWAALEDAGSSPRALAGSRTGVFVGVTGSDYALLARRGTDPARLGPHTLTGQPSNTVAGRVSYSLGLTGPSLVVDTACSSSLVAVHLACASLRDGECDRALAGGVNLVLSPETTVILSRARMMAADGRCKTFDAAADGYVRAEGCGVVVLRRLSDAEAAGERVLAVIRGTAVNHDGRSSGFTVPNGSAQREVIREALERAGVSAGEVGYVEAHGTGTALGDPIEVAALREVFGPGRERTLHVGSVKTNIGHAEAAAGIAGLIKVVVSLGRREIPPNLHFERWNPEIDREGFPVEVPCGAVAWEPIGGRRVAGVSAFGASGTNAHVVVEGFAEDGAPGSATSGPGGGVHVVFLSGRDAEGVRGSGRRVAEILAAGRESLEDVSHTLAAGRAPLRFRTAVVARGAARAAAELGGAEPVEGAEGARVGFAFTGPGPVDPEGVKAIYGREPRFAEAVDRCAGLLGAEGGKALRAVVAGERPEGGGILDGAALFAVELGLAELLESWGITPSVRTGSGPGALVARSLAGELPLAEALARAAGSGEPAPAGPAPAALDGCAAIVEVGPEVDVDVRREERGTGAVPRLRTLATADREGKTLLESVARLWLLGVDVDRGAVEARGRKVALPTTPLRRERHWLEGVGEEQARTPAGADSAAGPEAGVYEISWEPSDRVESGKARAEGNWLVVRGGSGEPAPEVDTLLRLLAASGVSLAEGPGAAGAVGRAGTAGTLYLGGLAAAGPVDAERLCEELREAAGIAGAEGGRLVVVTRSSEAVEATLAPSAVAQGALRGLARVLGLSREGPAVTLVDGDGPASSWGPLLATELLQPDDEDEVCLRGGRRLVRRLIAAPCQGRAGVPVRGDRSYLVTGGTGGLGLELSRWLVARGARHLVLVGRRAPSAEAEGTAARLRLLGARVDFVAADVADRQEMAGLLGRIQAGGVPLAGVFHAAGTRDAGLSESLRGKVHGAWLLHELTRELCRDRPLDLFVLFSSAAAVWGDRDLPAYAAANEALAAIALLRRGEGLVATAIDWGPFDVRGMLTSEGAERLSRMGFAPLPFGPSFDLMLRLAAEGAPRRTVVRVEWGRLRALYEGARGGNFLQRLGNAPPFPGAKEEGSGPLLDRARVLAAIREETASVLGLGSTEKVDPRTGFFEMGLESFTALELRGRLERRLGRTIAAADLFSHPNAGALAEWLVPDVASAPAAGRAPRSADEPIAVVGIGCRFPGGALDPEAFGRLLASGVDAVTTVPKERWDAESWYDPDPDAEGKMSTRWGGFLEGVDLFDAELFGISPREAAEMDPQQRILLEVAWEAMEDAGSSPRALAGSRTGVYVGITGSDYAHMARGRGGFAGLNAYAVNGQFNNTVAGRVSYSLGLTGPSLVVDTACSSSLVAVHLACASLRDGECERALAGGVNLVLSPETTVILSRARMMAADGRCKTFDAAADGYVRAEGCGVVVLRRLSDAEAAGERVLAVIRGTAVNHDGRSSGFTVPNGSAQREVIREALERAGVAPGEVGYVEAHGTGTALGDPIEVAALREVFGPGRERTLHVGSVKTNIGHAEAAAGIAGLIKVVVSLGRREILPNLHFERWNPEIDREGFPVEVPCRTVPWEPIGGRRVAGVSAFGASGTNAHVVVVGSGDEAAPAEAPGVRLPTTSFRRRRYWFAESEKSVAPSLAPDADPLAGRTVVSSPLAGRVVEFSLSNLLLPLLADSEGLVHAGLHVELVSRAVEKPPAEEPLVLRSVAFPRALLAGEGKTVQVVVRDGAVEIQSRGEEGEWTVHLAARLDPGSSGESGPESPIPPGTAERAALLGDGTSGDLFYERLLEAGFELGPAARWIARLWRTDGESIARIRPPAGRGDEVRFSLGLHPGVLEACVQLPYAALPGGGTGTYLLVGWERLALWCARAARGGDLWARAILRDAPGGDDLVADVRLEGAGGSLVASIEGARLVRTTREAWRGPRPEAEIPLHAIAWRPMEPPPGGPTGGAASDQATTWIVPDRGGMAERVARRLEEAGERCVVTGETTADTADTPDTEDTTDTGLAALLAGSPHPGRVLVLSTLDGGGSLAVASRTLAVVQLLAGSSAGLCLVTRGARCLGTGPEAPDPAAAAAWGLAQAIVAEHPGLATLRVDVDPAADDEEQAREIVASLTSPEPANPEGGREGEVAWRRGVAHVPRLVKTEPGPSASSPEALRVVISGGPGLDGIAVVPASRRAPGPGEVEIEVRAAALTFRDVLQVVGMDPGGTVPLGSDCAGVVTRTGEGVDALAPGDPVMALALAQGSLSRFVTADARFVVLKPAHLSWVEAATVPVAYLTAAHGLRNLARLSAGERVLIHAAAGGVGLAALHLARRIGAEPFATASPPKWAFLRSMGVTRLYSSRSVDFASRLLEETGGAGVDVVVNSLAGEYVPASLSVLSRGGRFLELGKRGDWNAERVRAERPDVDYQAYDLETLGAREPERLRELFESLREGLESGAIPPLPASTFPVQGAREAFETVAHSRGVGRAVVTFPGGETDPLTIRPDGTYLVTGAAGALGGEVARWLASRGARRIVLVDVAPPASGTLRSLEEAGARPEVLLADVASRESLGQAVAAARSGPGRLRGVIHAAAVGDDASLVELSSERLARLLGAKADGALFLHELTLGEPLDFFVLFSSVVSVLPSARQGGYAAANASLDALAHARRSRGLKGTSLCWGPWTAGLSAAAGERAAAVWRSYGIRPLSPREGLAALERALEHPSAQQVIVAVDWERYTARIGTVPAFLEELVPRGEPATFALIGGPGGEAPADLAAIVRREVARVLGRDPEEPLDEGAPLSELGFDSLMAVELARSLGGLLGCRLPATLTYNHPTVASLSEHLASRFGAGDRGGPVGAPAPPARPAAGEERDAESVRRLLDERLERMERLLSSEGTA